MATGSVKLVRRTVQVPAFDHVVGPPCEHCVEAKLRCDHGRGPEVWYFQLWNEHAAVEYSVYTNIFHELTPARARIGPEVPTTSLYYHSKHPLTRESVLEKPRECSLLGECRYSAFGCGATDVCRSFDFSIGIDAQAELLWPKLEQILVSYTKSVHERRYEDGDLRWAICQHCKGEGLIDRRTL